mgnify:FL=1
MSEQVHTEQQVIEDFWLKLDNAAKMYPALMNREFTAVFRFSATLKQPVQIGPFFRAVRRVEKRFPYFKMQLKSGFFWYYLEHNNTPISVQEDTGAMCRKFDRETDHGLLLRILVRERTVSVEFSHILTDGKGATEFFRSLLITYFAETGIQIPSGLHYFHPNDPISGEELEDSFQRYFRKNLPDLTRLARAFHLPFKLRRSARFTTSTMILSLGQIKQKASHYSVSVTEFLISAYLCALQEVYRNLPQAQKRRNNKILRIQVPVNLRNIFPSSSMRNLTLFVLPEIDLRLGYYTFQEILKKVHHQMALEKDQKLISRTISRNVGSEKNKMVRTIPLFIKSLILQTQYYSLGANLYSGELTNLGRLDLSSTLNEKIEAVTFVPPPPNKALKIDCGVIGFQDNLVLTFGNITRSRDFEQRLLQILSDQGVEPEFTDIQNTES